MTIFNKTFLSNQLRSRLYEKEKNQIAFLMILVIFPLTILAQNESFSEKRLTEEGQKAYQTLLSANKFEAAYVGYEGSLSKVVAAYRVLLKEEKSLDALKNLLNNATLAGQLYALCGLYEKDYNFFLSVVKKYKNSKESVETRSGCLGAVERVGDVVFLNKPNTVRLSSPTQSFDEWREKAGLSASSGFLLDISGGGYPMMFRDDDSNR